MCHGLFANPWLAMLFFLIASGCFSLPAAPRQRNKEERIMLTTGWQATRGT